MSGQGVCLADGKKAGLGWEADGTLWYTVAHYGTLWDTLWEADGAPLLISLSARAALLMSHTVSSNPCVEIAFE